MKNLIKILVLISFVSCSNDKESPEIKLGDEYKGGIVFYILQEGDPSYIEGETHGFIAGEDLEGTFIWGCSNISEGSLGINLGDGENNTLLISSACPGENASSACLDIDWYLPNQEEMHKIFFNKLLLNITNSDWYWSSSKNGYSEAIKMRFSDGSDVSAHINTMLKVKPIKKF